MTPTGIPEPLFPPDYDAARERFINDADRLGWTRSSYPIGAIGPAGEELTIDVAISSQRPAERALVLSSGLHGVEGFLGSAIQRASLDRWNRTVTAPGVRGVLIHALNPYGFAWSRRADADNIDVNRNFVPGDMWPPQGASGSYARLDDLVNPRRPPSWLDPFYPKALWMLARYGKPAMKEALVCGQYDFPKGLFYGGRAASKTRHILERHLKSWLGGAESVVHLDIHTGLGTSGSCKLLVDFPLTPDQRKRLDSWLGAGSYEEADADGIAYRAHGSFGQWCAAQAIAREYLFFVAEFGTYSNLRVFAGLRAENQAHFWGSPGAPGTLRAKAHLRELFCPASFEWRTQAFISGISLVDRAVAGLCRPGSDTLIA